MIHCNKCGYVGAYYDTLCPECKQKFELTPDEISDIVREIKEAEEKKHYETVAEGHHILADLGRTESQMAYAEMLEKGDCVLRDLDAAMIYYHMAAEKNDPLGAYRYSRLAERTSDRASSFWLAYSAALGCVEAYLKVAERYAEHGDDELANYYYSMAAAYDETDAIVTLAKRYYSGIGAEQNLPYAKWYMDKLLLPPIYAIKMAYKLRSVKAQDPGIPIHPDYRRMLTRLAVKAKDYGFDKQYHHLCKLLANEGDLSARTVLGMLYAEGRGCDPSLNMALSLLEGAAKDGSPDAYKYLGDIYITGRLIPRDTENALAYYRKAAELGMTDAYEMMGDIFNHGEIVKRDVVKAIEMYELGAKEGHASAREKADSLKNEREKLYALGEELNKTSPEQSFRAFAISAGMGYVPAYKEMARAFLTGNGIKKNRRQAFLWYERAVNAKDNEALLELGLCYSRGVGTGFDFKKAVSTLTVAARLGSDVAAKELGRIMENKRRHMLKKVYSDAMSMIHKKRTWEAARLLTMLEKYGHAKGIYTLGCLYEFGLGIPANRELASRLYEKAFELKFRDPRAEYKLRILKMTRT